MGTSDIRLVVAWSMLASMAANARLVFLHFFISICVSSSSIKSNILLRHTFLRVFLHKILMCRKLLFFLQVQMLVEVLVDKIWLHRDATGSVIPDERSLRSFVKKRRETLTECVRSTYIAEIASRTLAS
jgi:hypothetical protein